MSLDRWLPQVKSRITSSDVTVAWEINSDVTPYSEMVLTARLRGQVKCAPPFINESLRTL